MTKSNRIKHWDTIYANKKINEVSWYQVKPTPSLDFISPLNLPKDSAIIDIGAGDSFLVDNLLNLGYSDITVLDISLNAINRAKSRLGNKQHLIKWIVGDVTSFKPQRKYDLWHDRAAFHFLTNSNDIKSYIHSLNEGLKSKASFLIACFSPNGPLKCSGIEIKQYSKQDLERVFGESFLLIESKYMDHHTPFDTIQNFTFCSFIKKNN
ncbi:MAG: class I SAM-dependent methyltransferase [Crocinitomicaceae bacterium]|nr:class I SAM-dependent methyltransferase [Crocinitomicaceae bacterium]